MNSTSVRNSTPKTVATVLLTLLGLYVIYFLFLYFKNFPKYWNYVDPGYSLMNRDQSQGWTSWEASKMTYATVCSLKGGEAVGAFDFFGEEEPGVACTSTKVHF